MKEIIFSEKIGRGLYFGQGILYNVHKIGCPLVGGKATGSDYSDIRSRQADWYKATTKYKQFTAFAAISRFYGDRLLFFGAGYLDCDRQNFPKYLQPGVEAEQKQYEKMKRVLKNKKTKKGIPRNLYK